MLTFKGVIEQDDFTLRADFSLAAGARVAVMGPSGAGKSTLFNALAGFAPFAGSLTWNGAALDALPPAQRPFSLLFQDHNLLPHLSLFDNVALGVAPSLRLNAEQRAAVAQAMQRTGLGDLGARKPAQVSGGQIGRAGLARALLRRKPWILLDEPFAALGPALRRDMLALVAQIADDTGAGVLLITHDPADARALCPLTMVVADGVVSPPAPTQAVLDNPPPALRAYL